MRLPFEQPDITPSTQQYSGGGQVQTPGPVDVSAPFEAQTRGIDNIMSAIDGGAKIYQKWKEADRTKQWQSAFTQGTNIYKKKQLDINQHIIKQSDANLSPDNAESMVSTYMDTKIEDKDGKEVNLQSIEDGIKDPQVKERFKAWKTLKDTEFLSKNLGAINKELYIRLADSYGAQGKVAAAQMHQAYSDGDTKKINTIWNGFIKSMSNAEGIEVLSPTQIKILKRESAMRYVDLKFLSDDKEFAETNPQEILKRINKGHYDYKYGDQTVSLDIQRHQGTIRSLLSRQRYIDQTLHLNTVSNLTSRFAQQHPEAFLEHFTEVKKMGGKDVNVAIQDMDRFRKEINQKYGFEPNDIQVKEYQNVINKLINGAQNEIERNKGTGIIKPEKWPSALTSYSQNIIKDIFFPDTVRADPLSELELSHSQQKDKQAIDGYASKIISASSDLPNNSKLQIENTIRTLKEEAADDLNKKMIFDAFFKEANARNTELERPNDQSIIETQDDDALIDLSKPLDMQARKKWAEDHKTTFRPIPELDMEKYEANIFTRGKLSAGGIRGIEGSFKARYGDDWFKPAYAQLSMHLRENGKGAYAALLGISKGMSESNLQAIITVLNSDDANLVGLPKAEAAVRRYSDKRSPFLRNFTNPFQKGEFVQLVADYARSRMGTNATTDETDDAVKNALGTIFSHWTNASDNGDFVSLPNRVIQKYVDSGSNGAPDIEQGLKAARYAIPYGSYDMGIPNEENMDEDLLLEMKRSAKSGSGNIKEAWDWAKDGSESLQMFIKSQDGYAFYTPTWVGGPNHGKPITLSFESFSEEWLVARRGKEYLEDWEPVFSKRGIGGGFDDPKLFEANLFLTPEVAKGTDMYEELYDLLHNGKKPKDKSRWYFAGQTWGSNGALELNVLEKLKNEALKLAGPLPPGEKPTNLNVKQAVENLKKRFTGVDSTDDIFGSVTRGKGLYTSNSGTQFKEKPKGFWDFILWFNSGL